MFSAEQYQALHEGAGVLDRSGRGQLSFTGADRRAFLHGLLTNDIQALESGQGCYAALLTANGRMVTDMRVFELGDRLLMDVDASRASALRDRLDQFIFSEDARVVNVSSSLRELGVYGPEAARVITAALHLQVEGQALEAMKLYSNRSFETATGPVIVLRSDDAGVAGFDLVVDASQSDSVAAGLRDAGAIEVEPEVIEVTRIEGGRPSFGVDMDEDTIPLEAGIEDRAISLTKGCYVGQEIIIRVLHRGQGRVAKRLTGLILEASAIVPARGDVVRSGDRQIGVVTSATQSPALGRPIAMGYVHRDFVEPATPAIVVSDGKEQPASVTSLPFVGEKAAGVETIAQGGRA
jgi:tRNA-modifying protein YgfZ